MKNWLIGLVLIVSAGISAQASALYLSFTVGGWQCDIWNQSVFNCYPVGYANIPEATTAGPAVYFPYIWYPTPGDIAEILEAPDLEYIPRTLYAVRSDSHYREAVVRKDGGASNTSLILSMPQGYAKYFVYDTDTGQPLWWQSNDHNVGVTFTAGGNYYRNWTSYWCPTNLSAPNGTCGSKAVQYRQWHGDNIRYLPENPAGWATTYYGGGSPGVETFKSASLNLTITVKTHTLINNDGMDWYNVGGAFYIWQKIGRVSWLPKTGDELQATQGNPPEAVARHDADAQIPLICPKILDIEFGPGTEGLALMIIDWLRDTISVGISQRDQGYYPTLDYKQKLLEKFEPGSEEHTMRYRMYTDVQDYVKVLQEAEMEPITNSMIAGYVLHKMSANDPGETGYDLIWHPQNDFWEQWCLAPEFEPPPPLPGS